MEVTRKGFKRGLLGSLALSTLLFLCLPCKFSRAQTLNGAFHGTVGPLESGHDGFEIATLR